MPYRVIEKKNNWWSEHVIGTFDTIGEAYSQCEQTSRMLSFKTTSLDDVNIALLTGDECTYIQILQPSYCLRIVRVK